ncbi:MAG: ribosome recycling factor [Verrucomicrobia bacterium]|nr:ribosome recycling factor [Verrucomicrobiota bacterium]
MTVDDILLETEEKMIKTEQHVVSEFSALRTGKASPALIENIQVEAYGATMRLRELASISTPEPRALVVQPFDAGNAKAIEKAIQAANIGLNPSVQGRVIRLFLPELSTERRQELVKVGKKMAEDNRIAIRNERRQAIEALKKLKKDGHISEDDIKGGEEEVQKLTDQYIKKIDDHLAHKEKEIMTV